MTRQYKMFHFTAEYPPEPIRLSFRALIPGHIRQYLKDFQLEAIRFMHNFLAKGEFCVYNDESGLGKQAAVAVLLDAACSSKKSLIVVQNDDRYINGWEFHFNVLTKVNVTIIKDENDSTDTSHNIYIAKWSTLRTIDDLSKLKFDFIIIDNRGQMLNNSFCTSMLLKHYERKINILISSVDITSDLKLLHNVLRLGGRLDPQYSSFKTFEEKFKLPGVKELAYKRIDLEEYFCKRERLANYCKSFRLRRYCHQYESLLPLVKEDRYKINLDLWREKQNATNSESSSVEYVNNQQCENEHIKDTQELFEEYCRQKRKEHLKFQQEEEIRFQQRQREILNNLQHDKEIIYNVDDEVALINNTPLVVTEKNSVSGDNSDEPIVMSPLLVESDSDTGDLPQICNDPIDDIEIVDLSSEDKGEQNDKECNCPKEIIQQNENYSQVDESNKELNNNNKKSCRKKGFKKRSELEKLEEDIADTLKLENMPRRLTRHAKEELIKPSARRLKDRMEDKIIGKIISSRRNSKYRKTTSIEIKNNRINEKSKYNNTTTKECLKIEKTSNKPTNIKNSSQKSREGNLKENKNKHELKINENCTIPKSQKSLKDNTRLNSSSKDSQRYLYPSNKTTKSTLGNKKIEVKRNIPNNNNTLSANSRTIRSIEKPQEAANKTPTNIGKNIVHIKKEISAETPNRRQSSFRNLSSDRIRLKRDFEITPTSVHLKQTRSMQRLTRSAGGGKYLTKNLSLPIDKVAKYRTKLSNKSIKKATTITNKINMSSNAKSEEYKKNTQSSIISDKSSQDYESIQCAQRLSDVEIFDNAAEKASEFLIPPIPNVAKNSLLSSSLTSSAGFFSETDILVPPSIPVNVISKKRDQVILLSSSDNENSTSQSSSTNLSTTSRRTRALKPKKVQQSIRESSKVSNFTELLDQQNAPRPSSKSPDLFSNFSDLIQLPCTQPRLNSEKPNSPFEGFKIFGSEVKQLQQHYAFSKTKLNNQDSNTKKTYRNQRSCLDILEKMFEPSNKKQKQINKDKSSTTSTKKSPHSGVGNKSKNQVPILPSHPIEAITEARNLQKQKNRKRTSTSSSALRDDDIFEISNNGTFGSVMRLYSNGEISPVQHIQKSNVKQHNKITNYLIGSSVQNGCSGSQDEAIPNSANSGSNGHVDVATPSKRSQLSSMQCGNVKKSPKGKCSSTQTTKLTKWFTKPSEHIQIAGKTKTYNLKKTPNKQYETCQNKNVPSTSSTPPLQGKRIVKRRRLDLSFNK